MGKRIAWFDVIMGRSLGLRRLFLFVAFVGVTAASSYHIGYWQGVAITQTQNVNKLTTLSSYQLISTEAVDRFVELSESAHKFQMVVEKAREHHAPVSVVEAAMNALEKYPDRPSCFSLDLMLQLSKHESKYNPRAVGKAGERGLYQMLPKTAERLRKGSSSDLFDSRVSSELYVEYMIYMASMYADNPALDKYDDREFYLALWNQGENQVNRALQNGRLINLGFSHLVLSE